MNKVLVKTDKFKGLYVALKDFKDNTVVGSGKNPKAAMKAAAARGVTEPVLVYVPEKEFVHIY